MELPIRPLVILHCEHTTKVNNLWNNCAMATHFQTWEKFIKEEISHLVTRATTSNLLHSGQYGISSNQRTHFCHKFNQVTMHYSNYRFTEWSKKSSTLIFTLQNRLLPLKIWLGRDANGYSKTVAWTEFKKFFRKFWKSGTLVYPEFCWP